MQKFDKWFLPDGEKHLQEWMTTVNNRVDGRLTYQYGKYAAAMQYVRERRMAIDVGAHVGLWSYFMARDFKDVAAFEPMPEHILCWHENMRGQPNAELYECALGPVGNGAVVGLETRAASSGDTQVATEIKEGMVTVEMTTLDRINFPYVDLIKIDCEGYEYNILQGALATIERCKPCIIVEQKGNMIERYGHKKLAAVHLLESLGAAVREEISGDFIMSWKE